MTLFCHRTRCKYYTLADLLDTCDRKLLLMLIGDLGAPALLDLEIVAVVLYDGARTPKGLEHIRENLPPQNQVYCQHDD